MPISSFEKAAILPKSYKIQLAVLLFLVVLDQLVTPSIWNFSEHLIERKKALVLTFEFYFVNQVQVWTFSFIGLITWFDWKTHHNEMTMWFPKGKYRKPGCYILDFVLDEQSESEKFEEELFSFHMLLINKFYVGKILYFMLVKRNHVGKSLNKLPAS